MSLQSMNVLRSIHWPHRDRRIATTDQYQVHQQARRATIAVVERMDVHQPPMRGEGGFWGVGHAIQPSGEVTHQRRKFRRRREGMASGIGQHITSLIGIASRYLRIRTPHDQTMQVAHITLGQRFTAACQFAHITDRVVMIDCLKVIPQWFTGNGDTLFDHHRGFRCRERIPLNRIRRIGEFDIVGMLKVGQPVRREGTQPVEFGLLGGNILKQLFHIPHVKYQVLLCN